jgi:hypothetical protein
MKKLTVLFVALVMVFAALPAFAQDKADWAFYGSARMWTAWESVDDDTPPQLASTGAAGSFFQVGTSKAKAYSIGTQTYDDSELAWLLQSNSRVGATVKWGNIGGRFEYGTGVNLRLLYGTWDFGSGKLLVGQDYGSYFYLVSNLCGPGGGECNGIGFGSIYPGRIPQLKLLFGGLAISLEQGQTLNSFQGTTVTPILPTTLLLVNNSTTASFIETDNQLPRLAASYTFNAGPGQFFIGGQYNQLKEIYSNLGSEASNTIDAWTLGIGTKLAFGPFYTNATFQYGKNPNNAGTGPTTLYPSVALYNPATGFAEDSTYMGAQLILGFKLTDSMSFEGGVIWQNGDVNGVGAAPLNQINFEQTTWTYYLQMTWSPVKNVFIIPEIGIIDFDKLKTSGAAVATPDLSYGALSWIGIKWQINF